MSDINDTLGFMFQNSAIRLKDIKEEIAKIPRSIGWNRIEDTYSFYLYPVSTNNSLRTGITLRRAKLIPYRHRIHPCLDKVYRWGENTTSYGWEMCDIKPYEHRTYYIPDDIDQDSAECIAEQICCDDE